MTDRIKGLVVTLEQDVREDDCRALVEAIFQLKGVASVCTNVVDPSDHMNRERVRRELMAKLFEVLERKP